MYEINKDIQRFSFFNSDLIELAAKITRDGQKLLADNIALYNAFVGDLTDTLQKALVKR